MPIEFQPPLVGFDPCTAGAFNNVPASPGVYIVGVKIEINDFGGNGVRKFCPLYVGEATDLRNRISAHRRRTGGYLNQRKELFDFCNNPISEVYKDIRLWNINHWNFSARGNKLLLYNAIGASNNSMIYFNCNTFFDFYLGNPAGTSGYVAGAWHIGAIADLGALGTAAAIDLIAKINTVKNLIDTNFYFAYWVETNPYDRLIIEGATKKALEKIEISTYSDARYFPGSYDVDLSNIQKDLINLTGAPFEAPLIISV